MPKHYINETGVDVILDVGVDVGTVALQRIYYQKPDGVTQGSWVATVYNSYSALLKATGNYLLKYTLGYGDLNVSGDWILQAWAAAASGTWWGESVTTRIYDKYE